MIYRLIYDHIDPLVHLEWPTDKILVKTSAYYDPKILAIIDVTPQIRQEFLSLLIFGNTEVTAEDLARYGPRSLSSPNYVTGGTICITVKLHVSHCGASEDDCGGYRSEYMKARGKACKYHREIEVELTARYDGDGRGTASFRFGYGAGIDLSCNTRRLITSVLANVFVTNENVGIEGLFVATHRLASLELVAVYCRSEEVNQPFDGAYFKISRAIGEARPEIWVTAQRKDLRSG